MGKLSNVNEKGMAGGGGGVVLLNLENKCVKAVGFVFFFG